MASMLKAYSVMLDPVRVKWINSRTTPGAREFSKWVRDAIDLRIDLERKAEIRKQARKDEERAARITAKVREAENDEVKA